jgi:predicted enzyme related to lactoylglutathione lyase
MWSNGSFYWNELMTRDAEAAKRFYGATLGWAFEPMQSDGPTTYWVAKSGDQQVAGILQMDGPDFEHASEGWFGYVAVKDLSTALARATSEGGAVVREPFDVPGVGRIAIVSDNAGNSIGWMTPADE